MTRKIFCCISYFIAVNLFVFDVDVGNTQLRKITKQFIGINFIVALFYVGGKNGTLIRGDLCSLLLSIPRIPHLVLLLSQRWEALQLVLALGPDGWILSLIHQLMHKPHHSLLCQWNFSEGKGNFFMFLVFITYSACPRI